ncbi:MAG: chemotaxis protein CheX [Candidatus Deferrimicrobiaceae bacterium]
MPVTNLDGIIIDSVHDVFETLIYTLPEEQAVEKSEQSEFSGEMIASIQIAGDINGIVAVVSSRNTAAQLTRNMLGLEEAPEEKAEIADCAGEIVNMIAGNIKTRCIESGVTFNLSIPIVMCGQDMVMSLQEEVHGLRVPFVVEGEEMYVAFLYKEEPGIKV